MRLCLICSNDYHSSTVASAANIFQSAIVEADVLECFTLENSCDEVNAGKGKGKGGKSGKSSQPEPTATIGTRRGLQKKHSKSHSIQRQGVRGRGLQDEAVFAVQQNADSTSSKGKGGKGKGLCRRSKGKGGKGSKGSKGSSKSSNENQKDYIVLADPTSSKSSKGKGSSRLYNATECEVFYASICRFNVTSGESDSFCVSYDDLFEIAQEFDFECGCCPKDIDVLDFCPLASSSPSLSPSLSASPTLSTSPSDSPTGTQSPSSVPTDVPER